MSEHQPLQFEIPLNEQCRSFLRAESLISILKHDYSQANPWDSARALGTVVSLYRYIDQADLKQQLLQALDNYIHRLKRLLHTPKVDLQALNQVLESLSGVSKNLGSTHTQFEKILQESALLSQFAGRQITGMTPSFDIPECHFWTHQSLKSKQQFLDSILEPLGPIIQALDQFLNLTRQCALTQQFEAKSGVYKKQYQPTQDIQLINIEVNSDAKVFPRVSANKQCVHIAFYEFDAEHKANIKTQQDIPFYLTSYSLS